MTSFPGSIRLVALVTLLGGVGMVQAASELIHNGKRYGVLSGFSRSGSITSESPHKCHAVPTGCRLAPDTSDIRTNVIAKYGWSSTDVVLSTGTKVLTRNMLTTGTPGTSPSSQYSLGNCMPACDVGSGPCVKVWWDSTRSCKATVVSIYGKCDSGYEYKPATTYRGTTPELQVLYECDGPTAVTTVKPTTTAGQFGDCTGCNHGKGQCKTKYNICTPLRNGGCPSGFTGCSQPTTDATTTTTAVTTTTSSSTSTSTSTTTSTRTTSSTTTSTSPSTSPSTPSTSSIPR